MGRGRGRCGEALALRDEILVVYTRIVVRGTWSLVIGNDRRIPQLRGYRELVPEPDCTDWIEEERRSSSVTES